MRFCLPNLPIHLPITFDPGVRSKFQIVHRRTYAHSYHVCKFQGSSANSVGGDRGEWGLGWGPKFCFNITSSFIHQLT